MTRVTLLHHRLANQRLVGSDLRQPAEVVSWLGAMQAQEYAMAKWAIALRAPGIGGTAIEEAVNAGAILRTHVLRPTWHFVAVADLRWIVALSAPRVRAQMAYMNRQLELGPREFTRSKTVFEKALSGGKHLTRTELALALSRSKIAATGPRLAHLVMDAELEGLLCSGARREKQSTYALVEERVPAAKPRTRDAALAELTRRYFTSRGPATLADFAWWSGLTLTDAKNGVAACGKDLIREPIDGCDHVLSPSSGGRGSMKEANFLLPDYDEYGIAYKDRSAFFTVSLGKTPNLRQTPAVAFNRMLVVDGRMIGSWGRTESPSAVVIEIVPFEPLKSGQLRALKGAVRRYGDFLGKQPVLQVR